MKTKVCKLAFFAMLMALSFKGNAQATVDVAKGIKAVKVVDNKGTIKYFQSNNGITQIVNTTADATTTTWQLGGQLTNDTYIDATGKVFGLDGLELETGPASTNATTGSIHGGAGTGWTLLVRDEATGATKKLAAESLVSGIRVEHVQATNASANVDITVTGLPLLTAGSTEAKLFVYRNGIKLRTGTDFVASLDKVTITYSATDLPMYKDDIVEIQYIK
ncbi:hypothetical protein [Flavobacterium succinicans]|uniref:Uncharacterized protein n=1 Tax=Flavobacterium succinicans TaxID=29536 RepID=A0A199XRX8_9FLAO|nr:hypothetical protein [Flavobacterium succinicans]OAZ04513.1 hypothetical protein FLB_10870 [Flavobacterium succinicans]